MGFGEKKSKSVISTQWDDFLKLMEVRAEWGHKKYGGDDKYRDTAKDILEEAADILNILDRRILNSTNEDYKAYYSICRSIIQKKIKEIFKISKQIAITQELEGGVADVSRLYFDKE